jgi:hypothetical protein
MQISFIPKSQKDPCGIIPFYFGLSKENGITTKVLRMK